MLSSKKTRIPKTNIWVFVVAFLVAEFVFFLGCIAYVAAGMIDFRRFTVNMLVFTPAILVVILAVFFLTRRIRGEAWEFENKYRGVLEVSPDAIIFLDHELTVVAWSPGAERMFGYSEREMEGRVLTPIGIDAAVEQLLESETVFEDGASRHMEVKARRKDGSISDVEIICTAALTNQGGYVLGARDISYRKQLREKEMESATARAAAVQAEKDARALRNLIDIAAHELRHPASVFKGYARLLEESMSLDDVTLRDAYRSISKSADRLGRLVNNLLESALIERDDAEIAYSRIDPWDLIAGSVNEMQLIGSENEFNIIEGDHSGTAVLDADRIGRVLSILLDNAVKFSPPHSKIDIWCEQSEGETSFFVADRGPGVPDDCREKIFNRFYQVTDPLHHSEPGLGLGLHIARLAVELHGGWIKVEPRDGGGSVFSFGIPDSPRLSQVE